MSDVVQHLTSQSTIWCIPQVQHEKNLWRQWHRLFLLTASGSYTACARSQLTVGKPSGPVEDAWNQQPAEQWSGNTIYYNTAKEAKIGTGMIRLGNACFPGLLFDKLQWHCERAWGKQRSVRRRDWRGRNSRLQAAVDPMAWTIWRFPRAAEVQFLMFVSPVVRKWSYKSFGLFIYGQK